MFQAERPIKLSLENEGTRRGRGCNVGRFLPGNRKAGAEQRGKALVSDGGWRALLISKATGRVRCGFRRRGGDGRHPAHDRRASGATVQTGRRATRRSNRAHAPGEICGAASTLQHKQTGARADNHAAPELRQGFSRRESESTAHQSQRSVQQFESPPGYSERAESEPEWRNRRADFPCKAPTP